MAFLVQTDEGVAGANAYVSVQFFRDFFLDLGIDYTAEADSTIEVWIREGTSYQDLRWSYGGSKLNGRDQYLQFPRTCLYDAENYLVAGVPIEIKNATCYYSKAYNDLSTLFITDNSNKGAIIEEYSRLDKLEERFKYENGSKAGVNKFPVIQEGDLITQNSGFAITTGFRGKRA